MRWEELERRLKEVSQDGVEASLYYHGPLDDPWRFELSSAGKAMFAQPLRLEDVASRDRDDMCRLRGFLCELLGPPEPPGVKDPQKPA
ncbi:MAG: hypothetical protein ABFE07_29295 [Armatimonadia bacterium]